MRFSVIIPAYNAEKTLSSCLKALSYQSLPKEDYEVIVVDDGSTDGTSKIAKRFNVKYIFQANQGPATARNRQLRQESWARSDRSQAGPPMEILDAACTR